jgi:hypothetical protein
MRFSLQRLVLVITLLTCIVGYSMYPVTAVVGISGKQWFIWIEPMDEHALVTLHSVDRGCVSSCHVVALDPGTNTATIRLPRWKKWLLDKGTSYYLIKETQNHGF